MDVFWDAKGRLSMRLCGDASRHSPIRKEKLGVAASATGHPNDLHEIRRQFGRDVCSRADRGLDCSRTVPSRRSNGKCVTY